MNDREFRRVRDWAWHKLLGSCVNAQFKSMNDMTSDLHNGICSQDDYELYCMLWNTYVFRFSVPEYQVRADKERLIEMYNDVGVGEVRELASASHPLSIVTAENERITYWVGKGSHNPGFMMLVYIDKGHEGPWMYQWLKLDYRVEKTQERLLPHAAALYRCLVAENIVPVGSFNAIAWR